MHLSQSFTKSLSCAALVAASALAGVPAAWAANVEGQLDPHFSGDGRAVVQFHQPGPGPIYLLLNSVARGVGEQSDGKIVVAGDVDMGGGQGAIGVARLNEDGSLDTSFGTDGQLLISVPNTSMHIWAMVVQPDDKIVLAGSLTLDGTGNNQFLAARVTASGGIDSDFGPPSSFLPFAAVDFGSGSDVAKSLALASDGSIYLAGYVTSTVGDLDFGLVKLTPDGVLDTSFYYGEGKRTIWFDQGDDNDDGANAVAVQSDGKVVLAGGVRWASGRDEFGLARVDGNTGDLDTGFGNLSGRPGQSVVKFQQSGQLCYDDAASLQVYEEPVLGTRKIYAAGTTCLFASNARGAVAAFEDDGTLESGFGFSGSGKLWANLLPDYNTQQLNSVVLQAAPKSYLSYLFPPKLILVGSGRSTAYNNNYDMLMTRYDDLGQIDSTFGTSGSQAVYFNAVGGGQGDDKANAAAMIGDRYLVVAGSRQRDSSGHYDFAIARLLVGDRIFFNGFEGLQIFR